eukprot:9186246-Lingulodinium_polyedra.AAC.1
MALRGSVGLKAPPQPTASFWPGPGRGGRRPFSFVSRRGHCPPRVCRWCARPQCRVPWRDPLRGA